MRRPIRVALAVAAGWLTTTTLGAASTGCGQEPCPDVVPPKATTYIAVQAQEALLGAVLTVEPDLEGRWSFTVRYDRNGTAHEARYRW